ncbi:hypothetical protein ACR5MH_0155 (plasmid) [Streptomyces sp. L7]
MSADSKLGGGRTVLATIGILLLPAACCGAPLLIGAAAAVGFAGILGGVGAVLANPWVIAAAIVAAGSVLVWLLFRRRHLVMRRAVEDCCVPEKPGFVRGPVDRVKGHQR